MECRDGAAYYLLPYSRIPRLHVRLIGIWPLESFILFMNSLSTRVLLPLSLWWVWLIG